MNAGDPGSDPAVRGRQSVAPHSTDTGLEGEGNPDIDALLGDPHLKRQLEQLDHLGFEHFGEHSAQEPLPLAEPETQPGAVKNPLAPDSNPMASVGSSGVSDEIAGSSDPMATDPSQKVIDSLSEARTPVSAAASRDSTPIRAPSYPEHAAANAKGADPTLTDPSTAHNSRQGSMALTDEETPQVRDEKHLSNPDVSVASPSRIQGGQDPALHNVRKDGETSGTDTMPPTSAMDDDSSNRVSAYARLDFDSFTFYVQTLQVVLGRRSENGGQSADVDVHLGPAKAISRRHAKIFYNFATQRFELTVIGRNGAFVGDVFVETGSTVPLRDSTKVQIGQIAFSFVLPLQGKHDDNDDNEGGDKNEEGLEVEDVGETIAVRANQMDSDGGNHGKAGGLGSEKGRGGKLKQRAQSVKVQKSDEQQDSGDTTVAVAPKGNDENPLSMPKPLEKSSTHSEALPKEVIDPPQRQYKPRQSSFLRRTDENNLFAHVPPDQLAAVNAQVDAAIAGLPDIPGFDTSPNLGANSSAATNVGDLQNSSGAQRLGDMNISQLLGLQTQLGMQQRDDGLSNLNTLAAGLGVMGGVPGFQGPQDGNNGLQSLQQLQALQSLQGFDGLNTLQNLQGLQGLQPAAGLGLLQQLQVLQRGKQAGPHSAQPAQTRQKRKPKREYRPEEIPEQYRTKPAHSYSHLITAALRDRLSSMPDGTQGGLSLGDIYEAIMDLFPYYRYCPPGWQNSVRHNLSSSKSFRKVSKEGKGWLWGLDEEYLAEKEKQRQRALQRQQQQALAQQQAMAEQHAREQAREQARQLQLQRDRERELEQRRFLAERAARAAQVGVPLHQLSATLGTTNFSGLSQDPVGQIGADSSKLGTGAGPGAQASSSDGDRQSKPAVLPPETVKLLAGLQQHVQQELAKDGQPPLNPQLLSNALAVVIAQTAKQAGGLQNLGHVLQQPGAVQKLLNQAMQLLRSTQRVPAMSSTPHVPATSSPAVGTSSHLQDAPQQRVGPSQDITVAGSPPTLGTKTNAAPSTAQIQAQPQVQTPSTSETHPHHEASSQKAQPHILQPSRPENVKPVENSLSPNKDQPTTPANVDLSSTNEKDTAAEERGRAGSVPRENTPTNQPKPAKDQQAKKQQPSLEKISEILAKAEAIPNQSPEVKGMIEKLKAHKRQLELKRAAETAADSPTQPPTPKRQAVE